MADEELYEPILPDDYPIYADYCYVADGKVIRSDWHKVTAAQFKKLIGATELRRCDMIARGMKLLLVAALSLMAAPAFAQVTSTSDAASRAAAVASVGGNTTIFEASRGRNNTPDAFASATSGTTDCQYPGFGFGLGQPGLGASISVPLGTDGDCKRERLARFRMQTAELLMRTDPQEARRNIKDANELLCQISYNAGTSMCAQAAPATVGYAQPTAAYWYCRNPAGYYPTVPSCARWEMVGAAR